MIADHRLHHRAFPIEDDEIGFLLRHVAIDTVAGERMVRARKGSGTGFVARQAFLREFREIVLRSMHIMAGDAGHIRGAITTTLFQQLDLISVNIERCAWIHRRKLNETVQWLTGNIRKAGTQR